MGQSVLVFVSHSSEDKVSLIEPLVNDLEQCYINVWLDKEERWGQVLKLELQK